MKPTKKILVEFPEIEKDMVKKYDEYKSNKTVQNLALLAISWGQCGTYRNVFELSSNLSEQKLTEIYFTIIEHNPRLKIYD